MSVCPYWQTWTCWLKELLDAFGSPVTRVAYLKMCEYRLQTFPVFESFMISHFQGEKREENCLPLVTWWSACICLWTACDFVFSKEGLKSILWSLHTLWRKGVRMGIFWSGRCILDIPVTSSCDHYNTCLASREFLPLSLPLGWSCFVSRNWLISYRVLPSVLWAEVDCCHTAYDHQSCAQKMTVAVAHTTNVCTVSLLLWAETDCCYRCCVLQSVWFCEQKLTVPVSHTTTSLLLGAETDCCNRRCVLQSVLLCEQKLVVDVSYHQFWCRRRNWLLLYHVPSVLFCKTELYHVPPLVVGWSRK